MKKLLKRIAFSGVLVGFVWCGMLIADREKLNQELIRLHVVAASNDIEAQQLKLEVRDAVLQEIQKGLENITDIDQAKEYIRKQSAHLEKLVNDLLQTKGYPPCASVSFRQEAFTTRDYQTFSLPAGVYHALKIIIGEGNGKNWWCVVFPDFCLSTSNREFRSVAAGAGFPEELSATLARERKYELRFFLLECLGKLENFFR